MPKFKITVTDEAGQTLYDEQIEANGPREACIKAAADAATADVAETEEHLEPTSSAGQGSSADGGLARDSVDGGADGMSGSAA